ncbi:MAG: aminodeoxychorismate lyase [Pseudomonadota bacterium]
MLINGEPATSVSISDRGLAYGDGVFETFRIVSGRLLFEDLHLQRLSVGCMRLGIKLKLDQIKAELAKALEQCTHQTEILKLIVTRGGGGRGYRSDAENISTRIITLHTLPANVQIHAEQGIKTFVCNQRLSAQPSLAGIKHLNRLEQVLASREWPDESYQEGIMLDLDGNVVEGTRSNIFIASQGRLMTDGLATCGIAGVMRNILLQHFAGNVEVAKFDLQKLFEADEVFFCNSIFGVWPLRHLVADGFERHYEHGPIAVTAQSIFNKELSRE